MSIPEHSLICPIARGAYGEVWLARNAVGTLRAVKIVLRDRHTSRESFEREFKGLQKFEPISRTHDGLIDILTLGMLPDDAGFYYVMELADAAGEGLERSKPGDGATPTSRPPISQLETPGAYQPHTLRSDLAQGRLPVARVLELGLALAEALAELHTQRLVHRDIKPSNIIFVNGRPKLADIGLVTDASDQCSIVGTEGYIAPEGPGAPRADIFALGKVLYEALTGLDRRRYPEMPGEIRDLPDRKLIFELNEIILKACAADARQRYASAEAMLADFRHLSEGNSVRRRRTWQQTRRFALRFAVAAAIFITIGAFLFNSELSMRWQSLRVDKAKSAELYRKARAMTIVSKERFAQAVLLFNEALAYDPNYAPSHSGRANAFVQAAGWLMEPKAAMSEAKRSAEYALKLDPDDREALVVIGCVKMDNRDWSAAERDFRRALAVDENYHRAQFYYAYFLRVVGRMKEARELTDRALARQPDNGLLQWGAVYQSCAERQFERAIGELRKFYGVEINRWPASELSIYGWALMHVGRFDEAIHALQAGQSLVEQPWVTAHLAWAYGNSGRRARAAELVAELERLSRATVVSSADLAIAYMGIGDQAQALKRLTNAVEKEGWCGSMLDLMTSPIWDEVRLNPQFTALSEKLRLPPIPPR